MQRQFVILTLFLVNSFIVLGQQDTSKKEGSSFFYEEIPHFQGELGADGALRYIYNNLVYPKYAYERDIKGRVYIQFTIDLKGQVRDVFVIRGVHPSIDYAAYKVIQDMPQWNMDKPRGRIMKPVLFTFPIVFNPEMDNPEHVDPLFIKNIVS